MYTAVVLTPESRAKLLAVVATNLQTMGSGWEAIAHHMTICLGPYEKTMGESVVSEFPVGSQVTLEVVGAAINGSVFAVKVDTKVPSKNRTKHITIAVNKAKGAKPVMSNYLTDWTSFPVSLKLTGVIEEVAGR
mgnify:FL=1